MKTEPEIVNVDLTNAAEIFYKRVFQALGSAAKELQIDEGTASKLADLTIEKLKNG